MLMVARNGRSRHIAKLAQMVTVAVARVVVAFWELDLVAKVEYDE
jgi:hypothetical protein